jgi:hypothetical protein
MRDVYLEWARPLRLDNAKLVADDGLPGLVALPDTLPEGFGTALLDVRGDGIDAVTVTGELWSREVRDVAVPGAAHGRLWSALVFGSAMVGELDEAEMMVLAMRGRAVSPVTSYLAIEPGVRPSTEGLDWGLVGTGRGGGGTGEGTIGLGNVGLIGKGGRPKIDPETFLRDELRRAATTCGIAETVDLKLALQATRQEIVAVDDVEIVGSSDGTAKTCVEDGIWAVSLPWVFSETFRRWTVET